MIVHNDKITKENIAPKLVPKNFLKTAPVYPKSAEISDFNKIRIRDKSIGLKRVAPKRLYPTDILER